MYGIMLILFKPNTLPIKNRKVIKSPDYNIIGSNIILLAAAVQVNLLGRDSTPSVQMYSESNLILSV